MDPNATMLQLMTELAQDEPDRAQVAHLLVCLSEWVASGGFLPAVDSLNDYTFEVGAAREDRLTIIMDCSGSMADLRAGLDPSGTRRLKALREVLVSVRPGTRITVQAVGQYAHRLHTMLEDEPVNIDHISNVVRHAMVDFGRGPGLYDGVAEDAAPGQLCIITSIHGVELATGYGRSRKAQVIQVKP